MRLSFFPGGHFGNLTKFALVLASQTRCIRNTTLIDFFRLSSAHCGRLVPVAPIFRQKMTDAKQSRVLSASELAQQRWAGHNQKSAWRNICFICCWADFSKGYTDAYEPVLAQLVRSLAWALKLEPGTKLVEVGCGPGLGASELASTLARLGGCSFVATDLTAEMVAIAKKRLEAFVTDSFKRVCRESWLLITNFLHCS